RNGRASATVQHGRDAASASKPPGGVFPELLSRLGFNLGYFVHDFQLLWLGPWSFVLGHFSFEATTRDEGLGTKDKGLRTKDDSNEQPAHRGLVVDGADGLSEQLGYTQDLDPAAILSCRREWNRI